MTDLLSSTVKVLQGRELTGVQRFSSINPVSNYERMRLHRRILGHLSAVYCIAFDRTGLRIFTVSWTCLTCCGIHSSLFYGNKQIQILLVSRILLVSLGILLSTTCLNPSCNRRGFTSTLYFSPQWTLKFSQPAVSGLRWLFGEDLVFVWWTASFDIARTLCRDHRPGG